MSSGVVAIVSSVLDSARSHLNDDDKTRWSDPKIFPKFQEAYREMISVFDLNDIPIIHAVSSILNVPANTVDDSNIDMSTISGYPGDILEPIWMKERLPGQMNTDFVDMQRVDFIPQCTIDESQLIYWCWINNGVGYAIMLRGCMQVTQVQLRYKKYLSAPLTLNDSLIVPQSELYLSYRTAALCAASTGDKDLLQILTSTANRNLDIVLCNNIKALQDLPAKRRAYHRGRGRNRVLRDF